MGLFVVKLTLAPVFVVGASLAARRFGPRVGGLIAGFPLVAGPILFIYALAHGRAFASGAAAGTLLGLLSLTVFLVVYSRVGAYASWPVTLLVGWLAFGLATVVLSALSVTVGAALVLAGVSVVVGLVALPHPSRAASAHVPPSWDLPLRAGCAAALVVTLSAVSGWLGPHLSGLLTPFPIVAAVLAAFTHAQLGVDDVRRMSRGMVAGLFAFALFCFTVSIALRTSGIATSFLLAAVVALGTQMVMLGFLYLRSTDRLRLAPQARSVERISS